MRAAALVAVFALAVLYHAADAFLLPMVAAAFLASWPRRRAAALGGAAAALAIPLTVYILFFRDVGLRPFIETSADVAVGGGSGLTGLLNALFQNGLSRLAGFPAETGAALASMPPAAAAAGAALWLAAFAGLWTQRRRLDSVARGQAAALAAGWAGFTTVNLFWPGGAFFYGPPLALLIGLLTLAAGPAWRALAPRARLRLAGVVAAAALAFGRRNVDAGLLPQSRLENNPGYKIAAFVGKNTLPSSWIIISGFGLPNAKVYLGSVAHRSRDVLEYYFAGQPKDAALARIGAAVERLTNFGVPIYVLSDLAEDGAALKEMRRRWGVEPGEVQEVFGAGTLLQTARSAEVRVYLFLPRARRPELFSGLSYSILTEPPESPFFMEAVSAAEQLSARMSSAERRRAVDLLRARRWGFDMMFEAFSPLLNAESRSAAELRRARFAELQKTAEFRLRVGDVYNILGMKEEALAAWTKAQKLSGDADLLRKIEAYRRLPPPGT
ncbi:MAG: hypothetical protein HKL90_02960 [Elusimicrobia bacterium]|nr:hypothetical protein [Elusimicrobiota bacterium]